MTGTKTGQEQKRRHIYKLNPVDDTEQAQAVLAVPGQSHR